MNLTPAQKDALKKIPTEWTSVKDLGVMPAVVSALVAKQLIEHKAERANTWPYGLGLVRKATKGEMPK